MIKTTIKIDGMACSMCEAHINDVIRREFNVKKVTSSHTKGVAEVLSEEALDEEKLKSAIDATGYKVLDINAEPYDKKGFSLFHKK